MVTAAGGKGIPVRVDHADDEQIKQLFERVRDEQRRLGYPGQQCLLTS